MRKLLALLLFALLTTTANAQFRLASNGPVFNTSVVNDSTFIVDVTTFSDLTGSGYIPLNIVSGYRMFSQRGQLYDISAVSDSTVSGATLTIIEVDNAQVNTEGFPIGQVQIYDPGTVEAIPQVPFGTTGATAVLQAAVVSYNSILPGGSEAVVSEALVRGIVSDSAAAIREQAETDYGIKKPSKSQNQMALYQGSPTVTAAFIGDSNGERQGSFPNIFTGAGMAAWGNGGIGYISPGKQPADPNPAWGWGKATRSAGWVVFGKDDIAAEPDMAFLRKIESSNVADTVRYELNEDFVPNQSRFNSLIRIFTGKTGAVYEYRINNGAWVEVTTPTGGGMHVESILSDANASRQLLTVTVRPKTGLLEHHGVAITSESGGKSSLVPINMSISGASAFNHATIERSSFIEVISDVAPDMVFVAHSTNDQNADRNPSEYAANLDTIADRIVDALGFQPVFVTGIVNSNDATATHKMAEYAKAMKGVADRRGAKILDLNAIFSPDGVYDAGIYEDGIHYNAEQNAKIAKLLLALVEVPVVSLARTTPFKFDVTGNKLMQPIDNRNRLGLGVERSGATFDVNGEPLQLIPAAGGIGLSVTGDESEYSIYAKNSTTLSDDAAGYFWNDNNGYGIHSRARNGYSFWAQGGSGSGYLYGGTGIGRGLRISSTVIPMWFIDAATTAGTIEESYRFENNFTSYTAGSGSALLFTTRLNGGAEKRPARFNWQYTDAGITGEFSIGVLGTGITNNDATAQYTFGGGTSGVFTAPNVTVTNAPLTPTSAARLQEVLGTQTTATDANLILSTTAPKQQVTLQTTVAAGGDSDAAIPPPTSGRAGYQIIVTSAAGAGATFANRITSIGTDIRLLSGVDVAAIAIPYNRTYTVTCKNVGAGVYRWVLDVGDDPSAFTGWADYSDNQYTVGSPFLLTANVKRTLPNNAATTVDTQKPIDVTTFYTSADSTIAGRNGDGVNIMVEFVAVPTSVAATFLDIAIDIGGAVGEIYPNTLSFPKGVGVARNIIYHINGYTLGTWEANGGKVKVISDGPVSVYNIRYVVTRTHKAR